MSDTATASTGSVGKATVETAHEMLITLSVLVAFVVVMTMLAGVSRGVGKFVLLIMVGLLILQGTTHQQPLVGWFAKHPLVSPNSSEKGK